MKLKNPHLWIAAVSAAAVVFVALIDVGRTSPGPLTMAANLGIDLGVMPDWAVLN